MRCSTTSVSGSLVRFKDIGIVLSGVSGVGKSSLAKALLDLGGQLVSDDVILARKTDHGIMGFSPRKFRGYLQLKNQPLIKLHSLNCKRYHPIQLFYHLSPTQNLLSKSQLPTIVSRSLLGTCFPEIVASHATLAQHTNFIKQYLSYNEVEKMTNEIRGAS